MVLLAAQPSVALHSCPNLLVLTTAQISKKHDRPPVFSTRAVMAQANWHSRHHPTTGFFIRHTMWHQFRNLAMQVGARLAVLNLSQQTDSSDLLGGFRPVDPAALVAPLLERFGACCAPPGGAATTRSSWRSQASWRSAGAGARCCRRSAPRLPRLEAWPVMESKFFVSFWFVRLSALGRAAAGLPHRHCQDGRLVFCCGRALSLIDSYSTCIGTASSRGCAYGCMGYLSLCCVELAYLRSFV